MSYYKALPFAASGGYFYNTAWTTALNRNGERILTQESEIVTAHEFGHNWGNKTISFNGSKGHQGSPLGLFYFQNHVVFWENGQNNRLALSPLGLVLIPSRKSWLNHC